MDKNIICFQGQFVIAMPGMADDNFYRALICIAEHTVDGALGFIINRPHTAVSCRDIFRELGLEYIPESGDMPVFIGGPVQQGKVFVIHTAPFDWAGSFKFPPGLCVSNTIDIVRAIAEGKGPEKYIMLLGCTGWGKGQIEAEMSGNSWITAPLDLSLLFETEPERRWKEALGLIGVDSALLSGNSGNA